jgi:hypothetical protein
MLRAFLEEDLRQIQKYFPGAEAVTLQTPFDLSTRPRQLSRQLLGQLWDDQEPGQGLGGEVVWTS